MEDDECIHGLGPVSACVICNGRGRQEHAPATGGGGREGRPVDRTFDLPGRLEELRRLADDPDDAILAARIGRARVALPTVVHETGRAPFIFMTDDDEIEARWIIGDRVVHVTFGGEIDAYVFDRSSERIVEDLVIDDEGDTEILPGFEIAGLMSAAAEAKVPDETPVIMVTRYQAMCPECGLPIYPGQTIAWFAEHTRPTVHIECLGVK